MSDRQTLTDDLAIVLACGLAMWVPAANVTEPAATVAEPSRRRPLNTGY